MAERSEDFRSALSNIARQARSLLDNFNDGNVQPIERRMLGQRRHESGVLSMRTPSSSSQTGNVNNPGNNTNPNSTTSRNVESTSVNAQLRNLFPTIGKRSSGGKSCDSKSNKGKRPPPKKAKRDMVHKDVVLLPSPDTKSVPTHQTRCRLENNGFVVHAFPVDKSLQEEDLRAQIRESFPALKETDFEFVKSCYGQIITPKLATGVYFSSSRVLSLAGQGSIYIRPAHDISAILASDSESPPQSPDPVQVESADDEASSGLSNASYLSVAGPSSSATTSSSATDQEELDRLKEMFPDKTSSILQHALTCHGSVSRAALFLSSQDLPDEFDADEDVDESLLNPAFLPAKANSLEAVLNELQKGLSTQKEKLRVDEEDIFSDAMAYYKDPRFDPSKRLRVVYTGQPAVDTGGVTRHFFSQLLQVISEMFFHGSNYKSPVYNADIVASGMMKYIGTIIVHSILQGGPGFPVFSPSVYRYIATGDVDAAMVMLNYGDCSASVKNFIDKVAQAEDVSALDQAECANFLSECGLAVVLTNDNKMRVIQGMIIHDVISRPKIVLDQLGEGLAVLGFRAKMRDYPEMFEELFVPSNESRLSATQLVDVLQFPTEMSEDDRTVENYLKQFLHKAEIEMLENFVFFVTGSTSLPTFGLSKIKVKFDNTPSIFASTCLLSLTLPNHFESEESFSLLLEAVIASARRSFNCV